MRPYLPALVLLVGCGGGDDAANDAAPSPIDAPIDAVIVPDAAPDASPTGSATITGTVSEETIEPTVAYYKLHPVGGYDVLVMPEGGVTCRLDIPATGIAVVVGFPCGPIAASTSYPIRDTGAPCAPGAPHVWLLAEGLEGKVPEYIASAGSFTTTEIAPTIEATFTADFGIQGVITGTVDAIDCP